jgi:hypothetical protein
MRITIKSSVPSKFAVYCLTRGYGPSKKYLYSMLVVRNFALAIFLITRGLQKRTDVVIFHEGNVSSSDQKALWFLCPVKLIFIDIGASFKPAAGQIPPSNGDRLGYTLMCKFQYSTVWDYLTGYEVVMRVDEDVVMINAPQFESVVVFAAGLSTEESHGPTNATLPMTLEELGVINCYDHVFPYTNVLATRPSFWLQPEVQRIINAIGSHPNALLYRWGDLPIIGALVKHMGAWNSSVSISPEFTYLHLSHFNLVWRCRELRLPLVSGIARTYSRIKVSLRKS